jgi:hypothetical protein
VSFDRFGRLFELQIQSFAGRAFDLASFHLPFELLLLDAPITGDLVDAKMLVEILEVILVQPPL